MTSSHCDKFNIPLTKKISINLITKHLKEDIKQKYKINLFFFKWKNHFSIWLREKISCSFFSHLRTTSLYYLRSSYFYSIPTWDKHMTAVTDSPINLIWRQFRASCKVVRISHPIPYTVNLSVWKINQIWLAHQQRPVKVGSKLVVEGSNYGGQSSAELSHMADIPVILELSFAHSAKRVSHVSIFKEWFDRMTLHDRWK